MRILAIETTALTGTLALLDGHVVAERSLPGAQRSAQTLAPTIQLLLADEHWPIDSLRLIAVVQGPGSFTGLRVGVTTAKALAYALDTDVLGIDTLEVLAAQVGQASSLPLNSSLCTAGWKPVPLRIHAVLDAQRNQLFAATFTWTDGEPFPLRQSPTQVVDLAPWLASLQPDDVVVGPVADKLAAQLPGGVRIAEPQNCLPRAATVGRLAFRDYAAGRRDDLWKLVPLYHRASAAEEKAVGAGGQASRRAGGQT